MKFLSKNNIYILLVISIVLFAINFSFWFFMLSLLMNWDDSSLGDVIFMAFEAWINYFYYFIVLTALSSIWIIYLWHTDYKIKHKKLLIFISILLALSISWLAVSLSMYNTSFGLAGMK